ncbi:hypothetical protein PV755_46310 [Streptomyces caniscabiei]|uniref:Uncharacterized protein n=1 Tax=Streptomyces caniscabiei TaxID=2746961 RepID=A0A927KZZ7_9ACTN|nr:hypothetical protein [Streptomyces caniscabiei]MBD9723496.1 hypothetical protein [Streptomyces caniscabiei]MDX3516219.1 hypothetical protein [Streptomyces caniscabiei]MDX3725279.1 hypothetical protein [Streptomyces caniscabiei]WEO27067.1 hypothetical protein IHE65_30070 [Streptomyces caniscabiei]
MKDLFLITGCLGFCLGLLVLAAALIDRAKDQRPYLAARWDDKAGDWVNQAEHDVGPDPLRLLTDLEAHLKAYGATVADLYEPITTDDQTGDQPT